MKQRFNIPSFIYFIIITIVIIWLFPRERKTDYAFEQGKPWKYGLVTAPFDFPIFQINEREEWMETDSTLESGEKYRNTVMQVDTTEMLIQVGEKIIDRGELVNERSYNELSSLKAIYDQQAGTAGRQFSRIIGCALLIVALMTCFVLYLAYFRKKIYARKKDMIFLLCMLSLFVIVTEICVRTELVNVYIIPFAIIPIVIRTFFESRTAQMTHLTTVLICALMVPDAFEFLLLQFLVCAVALYVLKDLTKRSDLIKCAIYIVATYVVGYIGFWLFQNGDISELNWSSFGGFGINFLFVLFAYPFIYIIENIFGYISNVTLVELSDINLPALVELSEKSPGTFQHSLQVSMLGTAAASKVNANPQLVRTGALYHDLGKLENPGYFSENTVVGNNPHDHLTLEESAKIITEHVPEGVKKAQQFGLPSAIIKFIQTHHGKGKAKYFYNSYKNQHPDGPVNEEAFTYDGINPDTKETALLMMADAVEAASRSLKDYNEASIRELVNRIINGQIADGLLDDAPLTFQNISTIKNVFVDKLLSVYHSRVSYPELNKK
ncbi:MAG: HDIG domain-containing protein [Candidatus Symbiothrix sp.]|jgi:putative nucleotidyltransferase with HDIG domain|nr:HDIG domain-containing protein [Candidatus Symbiothrix sp.]